MRSCRLLPAVAIVLVPETAQACSVCFQGVESPLLDAARAGVLVMAVILVGVLGAFGRWFVHLARLEADASVEDDRP